MYLIIAGLVTAATLIYLERHAASDSSQQNGNETTLDTIIHSNDTEQDATTDGNTSADTPPKSMPGTLPDDVAPARVRDDVEQGTQQ
jgi:hypothetical protein